jgi:hypothetical protein
MKLSLLVIACLAFFFLSSCNNDEKLTNLTREDSLKICEAIKLQGKNVSDAATMSTGGVDSMPFSPVYLNARKRMQEQLAAEKMAGGPKPKSLAQIYTTEYAKYLALKEPASADFKKRYVAGAHFTLTELQAYFDVIKEIAGPDSNSVRVYVCPGLYEPSTTNPYNQRAVGEKLSSCLVFMKPPYDIYDATNKKMNINGNGNCLGVYNWADLEP